MTTETARVAIQPLVGWPHEAEQGQTYLMTVDVRLAAGAIWPYEQEEYPIYCMLTAGLAYSIRPLGMPAVVLHRFGGSYGPARFLLTALESADDSGLRLSLLNKWGTPILGVPLPMRIVSRSSRDQHEIVTRVDQNSLAHSGEGFSEDVESPSSGRRDVVTLEPWRVAQISVDRGSGQDGSRGSGYLIAPGRVLTAAHVVAGASAVRVRLDVGQDAEIHVQADSWWADPAGHEGTDLAVVTIPLEVTAGRVFEAVRFGRISDSTAVLMVDAFGFPLFKLRSDPADAGQTDVFRDFEQAGGHAPVAANRRSGTLAVYLDNPPPLQPPEGKLSPWQGMSGGPVWSADRIVGVVAEHHPSEGSGRLTACRIDRAYEVLPESDLSELLELLGLPEALSLCFNLLVSRLAEH